MLQSSDPDAEDHVPTLLPILQQLSSLLLRCRFPTFWSTYHSEQLALLRDNYTVEFAGFENSVREVVVRAVRATFRRIAKDRLAGYLDLQGTQCLRSFHGFIGGTRYCVLDCAPSLRRRLHLGTRHK